MPKLEEFPRWVEVGMQVWIPWDKEGKCFDSYRKTGAALRCLVSVAAGEHARIVNPAFGVDRWIRLDSLFYDPTCLYPPTTRFERKEVV